MQLGREEREGWGKRGSRYHVSEVSVRRSGNSTHICIVSGTHVFVGDKQSNG